MSIQYAIQAVDNFPCLKQGTKKANVLNNLVCFSSASLFTVAKFPSLKDPSNSFHSSNFVYFCLGLEPNTCNNGVCGQTIYFSWCIFINLVVLYSGQFISRMRSVSSSPVSRLTGDWENHGVSFRTS